MQNVPLQVIIFRNLVPMCEIYVNLNFVIQAPVYCEQKYWPLQCLVYKSFILPCILVKSIWNKSLKHDQSYQVLYLEESGVNGESRDIPQVTD
jgi:hypothetical protein